MVEQKTDNYDFMVPIKKLEAVKEALRMAVLDKTPQLLGKKSQSVYSKPFLKFIQQICQFMDPIHDEMKIHIQKGIA